mgnify:CR=1 FL=1
MGILHANVSFNKELNQIDINAVANEGEEHQTLIDGYVSPKRNYIDLGIEAQGTNMKFMESFCGSFMDDIQARAHGKVNLVGDLSNINLVGDIYATGKMHMKQLGTEYSFKNLHAHAIPDDILLNNDTIFDRNHNMALVSGGIHHKHLTRLSYDLTLKAHNFLGYDTHELATTPSTVPSMSPARWVSTARAAKLSLTSMQNRDLAASSYITWRVLMPSATRVSSTGTTSLRS